MRIFRQVLAIARTEVRFGFRRGALVVTPILIGLMMGAGLLLNVFANLEIAREEQQQLLSDPDRIAALAQAGLTVESYREMTAESMAAMAVIGLPMAWPMLLITVCLLVTTAAATCLPAEHKFGAAELVHSLPIRGGTFLAGKLLGMGTTVALSSLIPLTLFFLVFEGALRLNLGVDLPVQSIWFFIKFALLAGLPLVAWALTSGMLVSLPFRSRRAAILPGLLTGIASIFLWLAVFQGPSLPYASLDLNAYYLVQNYHSPALEALMRTSGLEPYPLLGMEAPLLSLGHVLGMDLLLVGVLAGLVLLARLWLKWKEDF